MGSEERPQPTEGTPEPSTVRGDRSAPGARAAAPSEPRPPLPSPASVSPQATEAIAPSPPPDASTATPAPAPSADDPAPDAPPPGASPAGGLDGGPPEPPWRQLHPASPLINLIPQTWRVLIGFWPLFLFVFVGGGPGPVGLEPVDLLYVALPLISGAISTVVHYLTLRYRVREGRLEIRQGLLNREARIIDPARIQNVELVRNPFHKLSGLVEVRMETAGDARTEGLLSALTDGEAQRLMVELDALRGQAVAPEGAEDTPPPVMETSLSELIAHGFSARRAGLVAVLFFGGLEVLSVLDPSQAEDIARSADPRTVAAALLLAFAISWALSAVLSVIRFFGFALHRGPDRLRSEAGLFTRRQVQIPLAKVQLVQASEPLLRRLMGYGSLQVETAALGPLAQQQQAELVAPMVDRDRFGELAGLALPLDGLDPWGADLKQPHPRALYRAVVVALMRWAALLVVGALVDWRIGAAGAVILPAAAALAWLDWRLQGWAVTDRLVISRRGFLNRQTWLLPRSKLQSVHLVQGPIMRLHGLGRLGLRVAGSSVVMPDIDYAQAAALLEALSPRPTPAAPTLPADEQALPADLEPAEVARADASATERDRPAEE